MEEGPAPSPLETGELTPVEVRLDAMYKVGRDVAILVERPKHEEYWSKSKAVAVGAREVFLTGDTAGGKVLEGYKQGKSHYLEMKEKIEGVEWMLTTTSQEPNLFKMVKRTLESKGEGAPDFTPVDPSAGDAKQTIKVHPGLLQEMGRVMGQWSEECLNFNKQSLAFRDIFQTRIAKKPERLNPMFGEAAAYRRGFQRKGDSDNLRLFDTLILGFMSGLQEKGKPVSLGLT